MVPSSPKCAHLAGHRVAVGECHLPVVLRPVLPDASGGVAQLCHDVVLAFLRASLGDPVATKLPPTRRRKGWKQGKVVGKGGLEKHAPTTPDQVFFET